MSADFFSDIVVAPAAVCATWFAKLAAHEVVGDIIGPDEETLFRFERDGGEPDLIELRAAYESGNVAARNELGPTYLDLALAVWTAFGDALAEPAITTITSNYAAIVALDRAVAIPRGVRLLGGHAIRHVRATELAAFATAWRGLVLAARGTQGMADACAPHLDRGGLDVVELAVFFDAIGTSAAAARTAGHELLLLGYPPP